MLPTFILITDKTLGLTLPPYNLTPVVIRTLMLLQAILSRGLAKWVEVYEEETTHNVMPPVIRRYNLSASRKSLLHWAALAKSIRRRTDSPSVSAPATFHTPVSMKNTPQSSPLTLNDVHSNNGNAENNAAIASEGGIALVLVALRAHPTPYGRGAFMGGCGDITN